MQFTNEYIKKNYASFFKKYAIEVEQTAMPKLFQEALEKKKDLVEMFSLGEDGRFVVSEYSAGNEYVFNTFRSTCDLLNQVNNHPKVREALGFISFSEVVDNVLSTGQKFSRAILRFADDEDVRRILHTFSGDLCLELPLLPLEGRVDLRLIVQNFYSELAKFRKINKLRIVLSVNPIDMLTASTGKVSSCNKLGGEYESSPWAAARSERMGIIRVENSAGEVQGRCWVTFSKKMDAFMLQKIYGQMSEEHAHAASNWITTIISKKFGFDKSGWKLFKRDTGDIDVGLFYDQENAGEFYVDPNSVFVMHSDSKDVPLIAVGDTPCLMCGEKSKFNQLLCPKCRSKMVRCIICNREAVALTTTASKYVCENCVKDCSACEVCGDPIPKGRRFCSRHRNITTVCFMCGGAMRIDRNEKQDPYIIHISETLFAHKSCMNKKIQTCPECGYRSVGNNFWYCPECAEKKQNVDSAVYALRGIKNIRDAAKTCNRKLPVESFPINLPEYALAA